jgi:hypothetical protein
MSTAIANPVDLQGQTSGSVQTSQDEFTVCPTQHMFSCWALGGDGHLVETWCKSVPSQECRATCPVWSARAA